MIKTLATLAILISFNTYAGCIGEAQINGYFGKVQKTDTGCRAFLSNITSIQLSGICPIDEGKLYSEGIEVGLRDNECPVRAGDVATGYLSDNGDFIHFD